MSALSPRRTACAVALVYLAAPAATGSPEEGSVTRETGEGLHTARLETPRGSIQVYFPDDLAAGDTISGTVSFTPSGRTEAEREENLGELQGYVVEVAEEPVANGPTWTRVLPELPGPTVVRFRAPRGTPVGEAPIPTAGPVEPAPPGLYEAPPVFEIPTFGQAGHPVAVGGPFSGDPGATGITIGGHEAPFLAQSPRQTVARVPTEVVGPTVVRVEQDGEVVEAPFRVLAVSLAADKLNLQRGERTRLHLEVSGLDGLDEPIPLTLTNRSPQVIRLGEGEVEHLTIQPEDVSPGGTYRLERPIESLRAGGFAINATAVPSRRTEVPVQAQAAQSGDCRCERISVRGRKPSSKFDQSGKKITVTLPFDAELYCAGAKGKCQGSVGFLADGATLEDWRDDGTAGNARPQPVDVAAAPGIGLKEAKAVDLSGKCPVRQGRAVDQKSGTVEATIDLKDRGSVTDFSGRATVTLRSSCGAAEPVETTVQIYLEKRSSPSGVVERLSDLDGNGSPDWLEPPDRPETPAPAPPSPPSCACERASASLKEKEGAFTQSAQGRVTTIEVVLPYEVALTCARSAATDAACSVTATAALVGDRWSTQSGNVEMVLGQNLWPAEIPCTGNCDDKKGTTDGKLTYRVALLRTDDATVKGRFELTLTAPCGEASSSTTYTVEIDTGKSGGRPTVKKR